MSHGAFAADAAGVIASSADGTDVPAAAEHALAVASLGAAGADSVERVAACLDSLVAGFDRYALSEPSRGLLDVKVLDSINRFGPVLAQWRELIDEMGRSGRAQEHTGSLIRFFGQVLDYKRPPEAGTGGSVLWADAYRFIIRELFLNTVAILIRHEAFDAVAELISASFDDQGQGSQRGFVACDDYVRTLDEFRNRRLQLNCMSLSSSLMRRRVDSMRCDFEALMQADFVLCLRSLVCEPSFFARWHPRTLVYGQRQARSGFGLFTAAAHPDGFAPLRKLFDVPDRGALVDRFETIADAWNLDHWQFAGGPLDLRGFLGLANPALRH